MMDFFDGHELGTKTHLAGDGPMAWDKARTPESLERMRSNVGSVRFICFRMLVSSRNEVSLFLKFVSHPLLKL